MALVYGAPYQRAFNCRSSNGRKAVIVRAKMDIQKVEVPGGVSLMAAAVLALTSLPALSPSELLLLQPARADSEELLTPYQRRQQELERRRELLRQTREQAEVRAGSEVAAPSTSEADAAVEAANAERRAAASQLASELKGSAAATYESSAAASRFRGFGAAPAPTLSEPAKVPIPVPAKPASAPVLATKAAEESRKEQPAAAALKSKKRRGPLPLFVAELLVLGTFAGLVLAVTKYSEQTGKTLEVAGAKGKELVAAAEQAIAKLQRSQQQGAAK